MLLDGTPALSCCSFSIALISRKTSTVSNPSPSPSPCATQSLQNPLPSPLAPHSSSSSLSDRYFRLPFEFYASPSPRVLVLRTCCWLGIHGNVDESQAIQYRIEMTWGSRSGKCLCAPWLAERAGAATSRSHWAQLAVTRRCLFWWCSDHSNPSC